MFQTLKYARPFLLVFAAAGFLTASTCKAEMVAWRSPAGLVSTIEIYPNDTFLEVISQIQQQYSEHERFKTHEGLESEFLIDFSKGSAYLHAASRKAPVREYTALTSEEKKDIAFIVLTLGNGSLASIASSRSSLKKAGDRIETVHPLKLLAYVFSDEKLKTAMFNLRGRTLWIWSEFFNGLKGSLDEESARNNVLDHVKDFAKTLHIDLAQISSLIFEKRWKEFINELYTLLPRQGETDRYNT